MGYVALSAFLASPIAEPEDIPEAEKTPEYWADRLGREWCGLPAEVLAEKLLPFFREFNRLCEGEKGNLIQATAVPTDPQCDQLHAADVTDSSGNVFADLGLPEPERLLENAKRRAAGLPEFSAELYDRACADVASLRARIHALETALEPFAKIKPSSAFASDGSDAEGYEAVLRRNNPDFTGADLARARSVLSEKQS